MYLKQLETFLTIANTKSFVRTAEQLYLSQPTVTQQIQNLENELGFTLLLRKRRQIELTPVGERFLVGTRQIVRIYQDTLQECKQMLEETPDCTIHYIGTINLRQIPRLLRVFHEQYPAYHIETRRIQPNQTTEMIGNGAIRLLLTPEEFIHDLNNISFRVLHQARYYAVVSLAHPLAQFPELDVEQLSGYTLLVSSMVFLPHQTQSVIDYLQERIQCRQRWVAGMDDAFAHLLSSDYIAVMPEYTCPNHPELVSIPLKINRTVPFGIAYKKPLTGVEKKLLALLLESYAKQEMDS